MSHVDILIESRVSRSVRARQLESMFDVPAQERSELRWRGSVPLDERPWNVGLIVGPSGSGKSTVARRLFGPAYSPPLTWSSDGVIDDINTSKSLDDIAAAFSSVGFNTIPAWLRPYDVLSNGEKFRVDLARRLLELPDPIVVDEFTSVVDRQVAQIGSHAVQKYARRLGRRFVAVSCHHDVIEWLQPDWVLEPAGMTFQWRSLRRRPAIDVEVARVPYAAWDLFAPYHYLSADLHRAATCFVAFVNGTPAAFAGMLHMPHPTVRDIIRCSRLVTLPDWQGLGLAFVLIDAVAAAYAALGKRTRTYPAHPALVRSFDRNQKWRLIKRPGQFAPRRIQSGNSSWVQNNRPCAVFEYCGPSMDDAALARALVHGGRERHRKQHMQAVPVDSDSTMLVAPDATAEGCTDR